MIIRPATVKDKAQVLKLIYEFDEYFAKEKLFSEAISPLTKYKNKGALFESVVEGWLTSEENFVFVAEENGELVGHIVGSLKENKERVIDKEGSIDEWFVTKEYRSKGIGKQLNDVLVEVFKQRNCNYIGLKVYAANKNTIDLYHQLGFLDFELTMVKVINS